MILVVTFISHSSTESRCHASRNLQSSDTELVVSRIGSGLLCELTHSMSL